MFTHLTQVPPTLKTIVRKRRNQVWRSKALKWGVLASGSASVLGQVALEWSLPSILGCMSFTIAMFGCYVKANKDDDLEIMPSKLMLPMRVFAKASSPSGRYFQRVRNQNRQFVMAEYRMLEKEFKRVSNMREQDLKSGNKRLFPPLPTAGPDRKPSVMDTNNLKSGQELVTCLPTGD